MPVDRSVWVVVRRGLREDVNTYEEFIDSRPSGDDVYDYLQKCINGMHERSNSLGTIKGKRSPLRSDSVPDLSRLIIIRATFSAINARLGG